MRHEPIFWWDMEADIHRKERERDRAMRKFWRWYVIGLIGIAAALWLLWPSV